MSRKTRVTKKMETAPRRMVKIDRSIDELKYHYFQDEMTGEVFYPIPELQKLYDYSKDNQFMFLQDWILALLYSYKDYPVVGITNFEKMLFLVIMEFVQKYKISTENPGFKGYYFGPYSERVEDVIIALEDANLIISVGRKGTKGEYFELTGKGKKVAKKSFDRLTVEQKKEFEINRLKWHRWGTAGLIKYVYKNYPEYRKESIVLERVLHRRRVVGRKKIVNEKGENK